MSLFANAYQRKLAAEGKGGGKQGKEAITELLAAMKKGEVRGDILKYAGLEAGERAAPSLAVAAKASQAEQARYQNSVNDLAVVASNAGVEEGFARIFRTLTEGLKESNSLVEGLASGFNEATKWADDLLLWPQSFIRALNGKDSLVADWLGKEQTTQLISDYNQIKAIWTELSNFKTADIFGQDFLPTLQATTQELKDLMGMFAKIKGVKDQAKGIIQEEHDKDPSVYGTIRGLAKSNWHTFSNVVDAINPMDMSVAKTNWGSWLGIDSWKNPDETPKAMQYDDEASKRQFALDAVAAADEDNLRSKMMASLNPSDTSNILKINQGDSIQNSMGLFPSDMKTLPPSFDMSPQYQPVLLEDGSKSAWQPSNPQEQADWNRQAAMAQAEQAVNNNTVNNQFDITLNVDATLAGVELEAQANAAAQAFSSALTGAFEQAQVNWPTRE